MNAYMDGDPVKVTVSFKNVTTGELFDPETVELEWGLPGSPTVWTYGGEGAIERVDEGAYTAVFSSLGLAGVNGATAFYQWIGTDGDDMGPNNWGAILVKPRPL